MVEACGAMLDPILGPLGPTPCRPCHLPGTAFSLPHEVVLGLLRPSPKGSQSPYFNESVFKCSPREWTAYLMEAKWNLAIGLGSHRISLFVYVYLKCR